AVDRDLPLAELLEVRHRAQAAADEPLDLLRAARLLPRGRLARPARVRGARQHAVLRRHPAAALALEELRHFLLDARGAQNVRVAHLDQHRALGVARVTPVEADRAQLARGAVEGSVAGSSLDHAHLGTFRIASWISAMARSMSSSLTSPSAPGVSSCCVVLAEVANCSSCRLVVSAMLLSSSFSQVIATTERLSDSPFARRCASDINPGM